MKIGICPYDIKKNENFWKSFIDRLSKGKEKTTVVSDANFEWLSKAQPENLADIYYVSASLALLLYERGYIPYAIKGKKKDKIIILGKTEEKKDIYKVAIPQNNKFIYIGLLDIFKDFKDKNIDIYTVKTQKEVLENLQNSEVDLGLVYEEFWQTEKEFFKDIKELKIVPTIFSHYLVVKPDILKSLKEDLDKILEEFGFELLSEDEIKAIEKIYSNLDILIEYIQNKYLLDMLVNFPAALLMIYGNKYLYANDTFLKLIGYSLEEFKQLKPEDIFPEEEKEKIRKIAERRVKGEDFSITFEEIKVKTKDGKIKYLLAFSRTILYKGQYAGVVIAFDITEKKQLERLNKALLNVERSIIRLNDAETLLENITKILVDDANFDMASLYIVDDGLKLKFAFSKELDINFIKKFESKIQDSLNKESFLKQKLNQGEILYTQDILDSDLTDLANLLASNNLLSVFLMPIFKKNKLFAILAGFSKEIDFINDKYVEILEQIKLDLNFALEKLENDATLKLVSEAIERSTEWFLITDEDGVILYVNDAVEKISGYSKEELIGKKTNIFRSYEQPIKFYKKLWETIKKGEDFAAIFVNRRKDGSLFYLDLLIHPVKLPSGKVYYIAIGRDITNEIHLSSEVEKYKFYDPLTELYNMYAFSLDVAEYLKHIKSKAFLILVDIYNMAYINNVFGISIGNYALKEVGKRILKEFDEEDIKGRIGGDEFGIFVSSQSREDFATIIDKINRIFDEPIKIQDKEIKIYFSAGVSSFPDDGKNFQTLYKKATIALSEAKKTGKNIIKFFNPSMEEKAKNVLEAEELIEKALREELFVFHYQPYFDTENISLKGFEALVRIQDKSGKIYYPNVFIDVLEKSKFIEDFERWALKKALQKIKEWDNKIYLSVNISGKSLHSRHIQEILKKEDKETLKKLTLEITERELIGNIDLTKEALSNLRDLGVRIAIDDFGTGYSSLSYLESLPLDVLKIDISFVRQMLEGKRKKAMVEVIISLAKKLDIKSLAEGVETKEQLETLKDMGCNFIQGYFLGKPMPESDADEFVKGKCEL